MYTNLPKVELHAHLGGSSRQSTLLELLTNKYGNEDGEKMATSVLIPKCTDGIQCEPEDYKGFSLISKAYSSLELTYRLTYEYLEDCAADGIIYVELRTGGSSKEKLEVVLAAMDDFEHKKGTFPISRMIVSIKRDDSIENAWKSARNTIEIKNKRPHNNRIVAMDFCGVDTIQHQFTESHIEIVKYVQENDLYFVSHFAELPNESDLKKILSAKPIRLGHALWMNEEIKQMVFSSKIPIECCISSNLNVMRRDGHIPLDSGGPKQAIRKYHPVYEWHKLNHPFVLCCDNIGLLGMKLSEIYQLTAEALCNEPTEQYTLAWKWALASVEMICAGEEIKEILKEKIKSHSGKQNEQQQM